MEDVIADDLAVDPSKIKVYYGDDKDNAVLIGDSPWAELVSTQTGATYTRAVERTVTTTDEDGNTTETKETVTETTKGLKITLKITGSIAPGKTLHFLIPTTVDASTAGTVIKNTAVITKIKGEDREITSETTYHQAMANLTVYKTVEGLMGSKVKQFNFTLKVTGTDLPDSISYAKTDGDGNRTTGTLSGSKTAGGGTYTFMIAHDEKIAISLPANVTYTLEETDAESVGYTVTYRIGEDGQTQTGSETSTLTLPLAGQEVYFTNDRESIIPTSGDLGTRMLILLAAVAGLGLAGLVIVRRRRRRRR